MARVEYVSCRNIYLRYRASRITEYFLGEMILALIYNYKWMDWMLFKNGDMVNE